MRFCVGEVPFILQFPFEHMLLLFVSYILIQTIFFFPHYLTFFFPLKNIPLRFTRNFLVINRGA